MAAKHGYKVVAEPAGPRLLQVRVVERTAFFVQVAGAAEATNYRTTLKPAEFDREFSGTPARAIKRWRVHMNSEAAMKEAAARRMRRLAEMEIKVPKGWE